MGIETAPQLLERDVKMESSELAKQAAKYAQAKSGGAGIGGILGAIVGVALAPVTGGASLLYAGLGGGLGALVGSKIGGHGAGGQESLMGGQFMQGSRHDISTQIAKQEGTDILMAAGSGMLQAGNIAKGVKVFKAGAAGAKEAGTKLFGSKFLGQVGQGSFDVAKGMTKDIFEDFALPDKEKMADLSKDVLSKNPMSSIEDITKITAAPELVGGVGQGGIGKVLGGIGDAASNIYGGADKMLGGLLPFGQPIEEGWAAAGAKEIAGLLAPKITGQQNYSVPDASGGSPDPAMIARINSYKQKGYNPDDDTGIDLTLAKLMGWTGSNWGAQ
jgi:hypothetical protein